jgi:hypothetical protein
VESNSNKMVGNHKFCKSYFWEIYAISHQHQYSSEHEALHSNEVNGVHMIQTGRMIQPRSWVRKGWVKRCLLLMHNLEPRENPQCKHALCWDRWQNYGEDSWGIAMPELVDVYNAAQNTMDVSNLLTKCQFALLRSWITNSLKPLLLPADLGLKPANAFLAFSCDWSCEFSRENEV